MRVAWLPRTLLASLVVVVVVCAGLAPSPAAATEEPPDDADDATITTTLYPGWNMVGWVGPETPASELFDELPALGRIFAWDAEEQRYLRLMPSSGLVGDEHLLTPGDGLWLYMGGTSPVEWTREASGRGVLLDVRAGPNLVAWAGRDGTPTGEAVARLGDRLELAWAWNAEVQEYRLYHPGAGLDQVQALNHGDALLLELSSGGRWWHSGSAPPPVVFVGEFTEERRADVREWMDDQRGFFAERWGVEAPITTYIGGWDSLEATYRRVTGRPPGAWYNGVYVPSVQAMFLAEGGMTAPAHAHEYFHAIQHHLIGPLRGWGPRWMTEGSAIFATAVYEGAVSASQTVEERIDRIAARQAASIGINDWPPLSAAERPVEGVTYSPRLHYIMGSLGVVWLSEHAGERSVVDFYRRMGDAEDWRDAFEGAFGLSVDDFHEHFEAYRAEVAPPLPHLVDDSDEPVLVFVGDVPTAIEEAVREDFDNVQAFLRETFEVETAHYTVLAAADPESITAAHMRAFGEDPGAHFCSRSEETGSVVVINLACRDRSPHHLDLAQFNAVRQQLAPVHEIPRMARGFSVGGPFWLHLAAGTYAQYAYRTAAGIEEAEAIRTRVTGPAAHTTRSLSSTSTWAGYNVNYSQSRALGFLAVEFMAELAGEAALFDYYRRLPDSERWEEAFEGAFGMEVSEFYRDFKAYRAAAVPLLPHLADDRDEALLILVGDVPPDARSAIRNEFESLHAFFDRRLRAGVADYTVFAGVDEASVAAAHQRAFGEAPAEDFCSRHTRGHVAVLNLDCDQQGAAAALLRVRFDDVIERLAPTDSLPRPLSGLHRRGPYWLDSPAQPYIEYAYQLAAGRDEAQDAWNLHLTRATYNTRSLSSMETNDGFSVNYSQSMAVGFLALDLLAQRAGDAALFEYYRRLPGARSWEDAFEGAFGITVDDFYEAFETHVARIAPPFPHMTDGRVAPVLVFVGEVPADTRAAVRAEFDAVQRLFRRQLGAGTADYTLYVGANQDALVDTYVRALGSQPPERLCDRTPTGGVGIINLDCRSAAPYTLEWSHFIALREQLAPWRSLPARPEGFDQRGPWWLRYGADDYVRHMYRVAQGHDDLDASRNRESARARHTTRLLSSTSTSAGFNVDHWQSRALGFLAVELLAELAGEAALFDYYRLLADSETWEEAFEATFGIAVDDFYEQFEAYRARVAPPDEDADAS